jgi:hypothetical protein
VFDLLSDPTAHPKADTRTRRHGHGLTPRPDHGVVYTLLRLLLPRLLPLLLLLSCSTSSCRPPAPPALLDERDKDNDDKGGGAVRYSVATTC